MQRILILAMVMWFAGFGAGQAQTGPQANPQTVVGQPTQQAGVAPTTIAPLPPATPNYPTAAPPASTTDPLSVPTSTTATSGETTSGETKTGTASASTIGAPPFIDPQKAVQLPGEGANTSAQAPITSASAASGGAGVGTSNAACSTAIPATTGASGGGGLFGAGSIGGC